MPSMKTWGGGSLPCSRPRLDAAIQTNRHFAKLDKAIQRQTPRLRRSSMDSPANRKRTPSAFRNGRAPDNAPRYRSGDRSCRPLHFQTPSAGSDRLQSEFLTKSEEALNAGDFDKASQYRQMALRSTAATNPESPTASYCQRYRRFRRDRKHPRLKRKLRTQAQSRLTRCNRARHAASRRHGTHRRPYQRHCQSCHRARRFAHAERKDALADPSMKPAVVYENGASIITDETREHAGAKRACRVELRQTVRNDASRTAFGQRHNGTATTNQQTREHQ